MIEKCKIALELAETSLHVFPLRPGQKEPALGDGWKEIATTDPTEIKKMWAGGYRVCNVGVRTGLPFLGGYLVVIDVDVKDGKPGKQALAELEVQHGKLPRTLTIRTASGGEHRYFIAPWPLGNSQSKIGPGIDVKCVGGYVVSYGSNVGGNYYTLLDATKVDQLPEAWAELCGRPRERSTLDRAVSLVELDQSSHIATAIHYLKSEAPKHGTYTVACRVRGWGLSQEKCLEIIVDHWPGSEGKTYEHIETRVNNAYTYGQDPPGIACAEVEFEALEIADLRKDTSEPLPGIWQQPADLWEKDHAPLDELTGIVPRYAERFGKDRARRIGVSAGAMTAATITSLSALIPASNVLHMRQNSDSWVVRSIIWTAVIGDPGTAKSPAVGAAMAFPDALEKSWRSDYARSINEFERTELAASNRPKKTKKQAEDAPNEPPQFTEDVLPPAKPKLRRKIVNDATTEALGAVLAEHPEAAPVLFHSDELVGLIGGMDVYRTRGNKDRPFFLSAKDGRPYAIDRKASGALLVPSLAISILGTIQDDKLSKIAGDLVDDGFLQRFALVMIHKTGSGDDIADDRFLDESVPRLAHALSGLEGGTYRLHPDSMAEFDLIHDFAAREGRRPDISNGLRTWLSKTPNEFGRYCLAFHLIEWASLDAALGIEPDALVPRSTASRARRYVQEFLYSHAQHAYSMVMAKGQDDEDVQWVAAYILTRNLQIINAREIGRAYRSLRGHQRRVKLFSVMASLALQDWVKLTNSVRGEWKVNPAVHDGRFGEITQSEAARRTAVRAEITVEAEARRTASGGRP